LKPEQWGSLLVEENNQEEKACDKRRITIIIIGAHGGAVVEALSYKPEGRGIDSRWFH
jgi:hypothetical protein